MRLSLSCKLNRSALASKCKCVPTLFSRSRASHMVEKAQLVRGCAYNSTRPTHPQSNRNPCFPAISSDTIYAISKRRNECHSLQLFVVTKGTATRLELLKLANKAVLSLTCILGSCHPKKLRLPGPDGLSCRFAQRHDSAGLRPIQEKCL
jgi:hypothetical protein